MSPLLIPSERRISCLVSRADVVGAGPKVSQAQQGEMRETSQNADLPLCPKGTATAAAWVTHGGHSRTLGTHRAPGRGTGGQEGTDNT